MTSIIVPHHGAFNDQPIQLHYSRILIPPIVVQHDEQSILAGVPFALFIQAMSNRIHGLINLQLHTVLKIQVISTTQW